MDEMQLQLSTSAETVRQLPALYIPPQSTSRPRSRSFSRPRSPSRPRHDSPSSPYSSCPSPSSPSGESVSSLPSVGSSFLFSSVPASPPHHAYHRSRLETDFSHHDFGGGDRSLIIPSLMLPSALRPPTAHGHTLGHVRLLVLNSSSVESAQLADEVISLLTDRHCPELVHVGPWERYVLGGDQEEVAARTVRMSTDWIEHREAHADDRWEPCSNVELVRMREYDSSDEPSMTLHTALRILHVPFHAQSRQGLQALDDSHLASTSTLPVRTERLPLLLQSLLHPSPSEEEMLYTAAVLVPSTPLTASEEQLITELRKHVPLIICPLSSHSTLADEEDTPRFASDTPSFSSSISSRLAGLEQQSIPSELRASLYQNPQAIVGLKKEAAALFLRWAGYDQDSIEDAFRICNEAAEEPRAEDQLFPHAEPSSAERSPTELGTRHRDHVDITDRLDATLKARDVARQLVTPELPKTTSRRGSSTKTKGGPPAGTSAVTIRGRPRSSTMERRRTITAATHARPVIGRLARLDSLTSSQASSPTPGTAPSPVSPPPAQSRRRRYAAEQHGLAASSHSHVFSIAPAPFSTFDPLHIPSLVRLALEGLLLGPLRFRLARLSGFGGGGRRAVDSQGEKEEGFGADAGDVESGKGRQAASAMGPFALIAGAFCAGVGVGVILARTRM